MALQPGSPGPQSVEARPSAWGGLNRLLDTPAKRGAAIVVILALMIVAPWALGPYATGQTVPLEAAIWIVTAKAFG